MGELVQAARRRLRGAGVHLVGEEQPFRGGERAAHEEGQARVDARRVPRARSCLQPLLAFSVVLAAGLRGIEESYDLPSETTANLYQLTEEERLAEGIEMLPGSLSDALDEMDESELVAEALGEHVFEWFIRNKRAEWREYKTHISQFELDRYYRNL